MQKKKGLINLSLLLVNFFLKNTHFFILVFVCVNLIPIFFYSGKDHAEIGTRFKVLPNKTNPCLIFHGSLKTSSIFKPVGLVPCLYRKTEHSYFPSYSSSYCKDLVHVKGQEMRILIEIKRPSSCNSTITLHNCGVSAPTINQDPSVLGNTQTGQKYYFCPESFLGL